MCFVHPDDVRTIEANEKIGELCGARADLARVGEHAATTCTWLSPTVGDLENVTPAARGRPGGGEEGERVQS